MTAPLPADQVTLHAAAARRALSVFFLTGLLMSFLGAILPAWGYHIRSSFAEMGNYFLGVNLGILASVPAAHRLVARRGTTFVLVIASALACGAFLFLARVPPPAPWGWRVAGMVAIGLSTGLLNRAVFHAISSSYHLDPAATINLAGAFLGLGCAVMALMVAGTFYVYTVGSILFLVALIPGFYAGVLARTRFPDEPLRPPRKWRQVWADFKSPGAVLFSLVLFFQFGNEWSVAGWLTIFLIQRLGVSPESSLIMLAVYWLALMVGRIAAQSLLTRVRHGKLLMNSVLAALLGCVILAFTNNQFGAYAGILMLGGGFAMIYPLVVEKIGRRFPYYHPGFFNGIFSFAISGGLLAPWVMGYLADWWGIRIVMVVPLAGTFMVFLLLLLLTLEARLSGAEPSRVSAP